MNKKGNRLKKRAVPCLHLKSNPLSDEQMSEFPVHIWTSQVNQSENAPSTSKEGQGPSIAKSGVEQGNNVSLSESTPSITKERQRHETVAVASSSHVEHMIPVSLPESTTSITKERQGHETVAVASSSHVEQMIPVCLPKSTPSITKERQGHKTVAVASSSHEEQMIPVSLTEEHRHETVAAASTSLAEQSTVEAALNESIPAQTESRGVKRQLTENEAFTPRKKKLIERLIKTKCTLKSLKQSAVLIEKIDSPVLRELVVNACKNEKRKPKGRRWTTQHKISCLAILKRSPKTYRYLSTAVTLPSIKTLQNILKKVPMQPGISQSVLNHLKAISNAKDERDKICSLAFDEMAIKSRLLHNEANDIVEGFQDLGEFGRTGELADHALLFMLQGIRKKFKQPIAFYFTKGTISSAKLAIIIKKIITEVAACGFTVLNTVCDQGPTNMGALKILRDSSGPSEEDSNHFFKVEERKVFIVYDIPHLFKSMRNNFMKAGNIILNEKKGKWEHLVEMETHNRNFLYLSKVTQAHINPKYRAKMRVKLAAQLLSNTVSAVLKLMARAESGDKATDLQNTAEVVGELDLLFDVTNGPSGPHDKKRKIRQNVSQKSIHMDKWAQYIKMLKNTKFINKNGVQAKNVKCVEGYIISLKSLRDLWVSVRALDFKYLNLRNLNQDALENLFGVIRQHSPTNRNPTATHFVAALKTAIITGLTAPHSRGANCEQDNKKLLTDFHKFVFEEVKPDDGKVLIPVDVSSGDNKENEGVISTDEDFPLFHLDEEEVTRQDDFTLFSQQPTVYVAGYLASQILKKLQCEECKSFLTVQNPGENPMYSFILLREWWQNKFSLTYPSERFCQSIKSLVDTTEKYLLPLLHEPNVSLLGCTLYSVHCTNLSFGCTIHENELRKICYEKTCKLLIRRQCERINENLASKEDELANINKRAEQIGKAK